jgi:hypothetical protein
MADSPFQTPPSLTTFANSVATTPAPGSPPVSPVAPTPAPGIVSPPSQTQSTDVTTLGTPTLSSSQLPTPSPYTPSPVPDLSTITAQGTAPTASQGQYDDITKQIGALTGQLSGQTDFANNLQTQYNVPTLTATANDLTANIQNIQNQRDSVQQQLKNQYGSDASKGYLSFEQQSVDSELAAKQSAYASTLATISGQLSTAKSYIEDAVKNKYDPTNNQIAALKSLADLVKGTLDNEQQKQLAVMTAKLADRTAQVAANKAISTTMLEKIAVAAANPGKPAPSYIVSQAQAAALSDNPASALAIIGPYLNDPLAAQKEIADIQQSKASTAASYADTNLKNVQASQLKDDGSPAQREMEQQYRTVLTKALSSRSGGLGLQQAKVDQANHLQALLTQYKSTDAQGNVTYNIPTSQYAELAMGLANLVSPSGSAESDRKNIMAATAQSGLAGALQYITGQPQNGNSQAIIKNLVDSINRQGQVANGLRDQYVSYMKGLAPTGLAQERIDALNKGVLPSFDPNGNGLNVDTGSAVAGQGSPTPGATGTLPDGTVVTLNADGSITDAQGNKYDQDGNKL